MSMFVNSLLNYAYFEIFAYPWAKHKTEKHNFKPIYILFVINYICMIL